jgi:hypothetical protein
LIPFAPATPQNSTDSLDDKSPATLEDVGPLIVRSVTLDRYANRDGVFVLVCSGSLEADGVKKLIEIV